MIIVAHLTANVFSSISNCNLLAAVHQKYYFTAQTNHLICVFLLSFLRITARLQLSLGVVFEMQSDSSCQLFLHQCHHLLLVVKLISPLDDFGELTELPDVDCLEYNSSTMFYAEWHSRV